MKSLRRKKMKLKGFAKCRNDFRIGRLSKETRLESQERHVQEKEREFEYQDG